MCFDNTDIRGDGEWATPPETEDYADLPDIEDLEPPSCTINPNAGKGRIATDEEIDAREDLDDHMKSRFKDMLRCVRQARGQTDEDLAIDDEVNRPEQDPDEFLLWCHKREIESEEQWKERMRARRKSLYDFGFDEDQIETLRRSHPLMRPVGHIVWTPQRLDCYYFPLKYGGRSLNELGNAARFASLFFRHAKYCSPWQKWLIWDQKRWEIDESHKALTLASETIDLIREVAKDWPEDDEDSRKRRRRLFQFAEKSGSAASLENITKLAGRLYLRAKPDEFDSDPWLFNCDNGTIDLRKGELQDHNPDDLITKLAPIEYHADAKSELWDDFIEQITEGDEQLAALLQELAGYFLTGSTQEHIFPVFWGEGRNGKGVLLDTLTALMDDYAANTPVETFLKKPTGSIPNDLAALTGARLVIASESEEGQRLATGLVKRVTGEDPITARFLHKEYFTYQPTYKVVFVTNNLPNVPADDKAFWRRAMLIPFTFVVPESEEDKELRHKLQQPEHLQAVLAWAVEGCLRWQEHGFTVCDRVTEATAQYREDVDWFSSWLNASCIVDAGNDEVRSTPTELLENYNAWARRSGAPQLSPKDFAEALRRRHIHKKSSNGRDTYRGIRPKLAIDYTMPSVGPVASTKTDAAPEERVSDNSERK